jgi:cytidine deaminase
MDHHEISFRYNIYPDKSALPGDDVLLLASALKATGLAYAPYSKFKVGVAIRTLDGKTIQGSNQENGAFPTGQCAERVALYSLSHQHGRIPIDTIAIVVDHENQKSPASPCGSCRQVLNEYRDFQEIPIRLLLGSMNSPEIFEINDVRDLLPFAFNGTFLGQ